MTPDQIIKQIWDLNWYEVMKIAIYDDYILMYKIWPGIILITLIYAICELIKYKKRK